MTSRPCSTRPSPTPLRIGTPPAKPPPAPTNWNGRPRRRRTRLRANGKDAAKKAKLQTQLDELEAAAAKERKLQADEQVAGDAIYWPLFNLDHKNPNSADALEHRPPQELVASILTKEREILRLMEEIQTEVEALA